eukprot:TRINITY_DN59858_c0_g1_i1.p1 TRINITY_DN59858_c0_g1~~TRINITY_DN59858_c0_g1_i1.p1  ORF type:complete len:253 (-),score=56.90 TRINITY_DN59858_c0_g1_i1:42-800(-)
MEARRNAKRVLGSGGVADLLNPVDGYRDGLRRKGIEPRNHARENVRKMRETAALMKEKKISSEQNSKDFKLSKFKEVGARVFEPTESTGEKKEFLKRRTSKGPPKLPDKPFVPKRQLTKPPVPKAVEAQSRPLVRESSKKDFIKSNAVTAIRTKTARPAEKKEEAYRSNSHGKVPSYLVKRKANWEHEREVAEQQRLERERCPPGMMILPEEDRVAYLNDLTKSKFSDAPHLLLQGFNYNVLKFTPRRHRVT